jgi:hypothetical protein
LADIGVVYLYRFAEGDLPARAFLNSYRAHPAGIDHDLHVIFKGFPDARSLTAARTIFADLRINSIELDDTGYDVGSYFFAAKVVSNQRLIFFNSFTELLADDWLAKFDNALNLPNIGLVGATASWQSLSSYYEVLIRLVLSETDRLLIAHAKGAGRADGAETVRGDSHTDEVRSTPARRRGLYLLLRLDKYLLSVYEYGRYPNPHIRSNAFMIERDRFLSLRTLSFGRKSNAYKFESGRRSMTKQIMAQNLKPIVIDRYGNVYDIPEWKASSTYWVDEQVNLIAADNRTRQYAAGSEELRTRLMDYAWVHPSRWTLRVHRSRLTHDQQ